MRAASFDLGGESGKKASIHFQCFDPRARARSRSRRSIRLSRSKTHQGTLHSLSSLPPASLFEIKNTTRAVTPVEGRGEILEEPDETSRMSDARASRGNCSGFDGSTLLSTRGRCRAEGVGGRVYSREISLIIRLINWPASTRRACTGSSLFSI